MSVFASVGHPCKGGPLPLSSRQVFDLNTRRLGESNFLQMHFLNPYDERFGRVWRSSYSFTLGGFWWSRTPRELGNVLV